MCIRDADNNSGFITTGVERKKFLFTKGITIGDFTIIKARDGKILIVTNEGEDMLLPEKKFTDALEAFWQANF